MSLAELAHPRRSMLKARLGHVARREQRVFAKLSATEGDRRLELSKELG